MVVEIAVKLLHINEIIEYYGKYLKSSHCLNNIVKNIAHQIPQELE